MIDHSGENLVKLDEPPRAVSSIAEPEIVDAGPGSPAAASGRPSTAGRRLPLAGLLSRRGGVLRSDLGKNLFGLVDQFLVSGTRFATTVLIGRLCGPDELGVYSMAFALFMFVATVQESLLLIPYTIYGCRLKEERKRAEYAGNVLVQFGVLALVAMLGLGAAGLVLPAGKLAALGPAMWVLVGVIPFALLREFCRRFSFAHLRAGQAFLLDLVVGITQVGGLAVLAVTGLLSAATAFAVMGLASAVAGGAWLIAARKRFVLRKRRFRAEVRRNWWLGRWVFAGNMTSMVYGSWLYWLLALAIDTRAAGIFAACQAIVALSNPVIFGVGNVLAPSAAHLVADRNLIGLRHLVVKTTLLMVALTVAFLAVVVIFGNWLLLLLYGAEYAGHGELASVLAAGVLASAAGMAPGAGLSSLERTDVNFRFEVLGLVVMVLVTLALILPWGVLGVACGVLACNVTKTAARWTAFLRELRGPVGKEAFA